MSDDTGDPLRSAVAPAAGGLSAAEAATRLAADGPNEIQASAPPTVLTLVLRQFDSPLIWLLGGACAVAFAIGEVADTIAIVAIVLVNAAVGFAQEYRAERAVEALRAMTAPRARVLRDGQVATVPAAEVVRGDVLVLARGDVVAADAELLEAHALAVNEAALTGESIPSEKAVGATPPDTPLAERSGDVFMGTAVVNGTGRARVTATGMATQLGGIANLVEHTGKVETPLQQDLARVSVTLLGLCIGIVAVIALLGLLRGEPVIDVLLTSVSLAVAAVPEGLPAIVTIALAVGVQRMAARQVLVRRLLAVEALGSTSVICTDKTGTLTTGRMEVREVWGADPARLHRCAVACCDAELAAEGVEQAGDPTELALLAAARAAGIERADIERRAPRVGGQPFDADRKRMSVFRADGVLYVKGAPDRILPLCLHAPPEAGAALDDMSARGLRVLAVACGTHAAEEDLELIGLIGIADPPRPEVPPALAAARAAGIRTVMITGDHPSTATAIAREIGLLTDADDAAECVHARATPADKLRIIDTWQTRGAVVAMTGDGVNDAPALREAHIGIAMGRNGTEVTRAAADVILADDNYASIVAGIEEGRAIFANIRKALGYLLSGNASELLLMFVAGLVGLPLPLLPMHLLWINLVTDGMPALALVLEPVHGDIMREPPRAAHEASLGRRQWTMIVLTGVFEAGVVLGVFAWALATRDLAAARDLAFTTLVGAELLRSFAWRSPSRTCLELGMFSNPRLFVVVMLSLGVQVAIHHVDATRALFKLTELTPADYAVALCGAVAPWLATELAKLVLRARRGR